MSLDVLYLTHNRREFTELTFELLVQNTNWSLVDKLVVYDDDSTDGALEAVVSRTGRVPVPTTLINHDWGSPVAVMNHYAAHADSEFFAKIDNDLALPPHWLDAFMGVMNTYPGLVLLGSESPFMGPPSPDWNGTYTYTPWRHIGGNGVMRTEFFRETGPMDVDGYHGFTGHQWRWKPIRGWLTPDIMLCLLDRCPAEPWVSLSEEYVERGWQRRWGKIGVEYSCYWDWFTNTAEEAA